MNSVPNGEPPGDDEKITAFPRRRVVRNPWDQATLDCLTSMIASSPVGMALIDRSMVVRAANATFAQQLRVPLKKILDAPLERFAPGWAAQLDAIFRQIGETGLPFTSDAYPIQFMGQPARGLTYWEYCVSPVSGNGQSNGYLFIQREITERVRVDQELRLQIEDLRRRVSELESSVSPKLTLEQSASFDQRAAYPGLSQHEIAAIGALIRLRQATPKQIADDLHIDVTETQLLLDRLLTLNYVLKTVKNHATLYRAAMRPLGL